MQDVFPDRVRILKTAPTIALIAEQSIDWRGVRQMALWLREHRPGCLPEGYDPAVSDYDADQHAQSHGVPPEAALFPHGMLRDPEADPEESNMLSDNELLVELAGRKCYDSFGLDAGRKTNAAYVANIMGGVDRTPEQIATDLTRRIDSATWTKTHAGDRRDLDADIAVALRAERDRVPHASVLYHAKMTFFFAGVSRRVSQELMRNYVGSDRDHEGSPSQESTRFTYHYGTFVAPPYVLEDPARLVDFEESCRRGYDDYRAFIEREVERFSAKHGRRPTGIERKRILEASVGVMPWSFETSFIWTSNPGAMTKLFVERDNPAADAEFARFARTWKRIAVGRSPNLFPRFVAEMREGGRP